MFFVHKHEVSVLPDGSEIHRPVDRDRYSSAVYPDESTAETIARFLNHAEHDRQIRNPLTARYVYSVAVFWPAVERRPGGLAS